MFPVVTAEDLYEISHWFIQYHLLSFQILHIVFPLLLYLQLAPFDPSGDETTRAFSGVRWAQTYGYGYVPNPLLERFFIAVAIDTPDFDNLQGRYVVTDLFKVEYKMLNRNILIRGVLTLHAQNTQNVGVKQYNILCILLCYTIQ